MDLFKRSQAPCAVQTARSKESFFPLLDGGIAQTTREYALYDSLRQAVPIVDAAINKTIRLTGSFQVTAKNAAANEELDRFVSEVKVGSCGFGLHQFVVTYLDNLLTYGNAVGEMVLSRDRRSLGALYNAPLDNIVLTEGNSPLELVVCTKDKHNLKPQPVPYPQLIVASALNPPAGTMVGRSLLAGLPFVSSILLKIYQTIGQNFERVGNLRFAVTYNPGASPLDRAAAKEIAQNIATQWSGAMSSAKNGVVKDFVAVGDVNIKVIGADSQILDTEVPVRQMLEQIIAKLGIPPFILGLSWSSTERMSSQQADILTSELESYRMLLTPVIQKVCSTHLALCGLPSGVTVEWDNINIQDEIELARANLLHAQAASLTQQEEVNP